jgi:ATP-binding cassette subfamily F protein 3
VKQAEAEIARIEGEIAVLEEKMTTPEGCQDQKLYIEHGNLKKQLDEMTNQWMELSEELECQ